jgi:hypothetical protein
MTDDLRRRAPTVTHRYRLRDGREVRHRHRCGSPDKYDPALVGKVQNALRTAADYPSLLLTTEVLDALAAQGLRVVDADWLAMVETCGAVRDAGVCRLPVGHYGPHAIAAAGKP